MADKSFLSSTIFVNVTLEIYILTQALDPITTLEKH